MNRRQLLKRSAGVVSVPLLSGCIGGSSPEEAIFEVDTFGEWSGSVGTAGSTRSISGRGRESYTISNPGIVSGNAQKRERGSSTLTVRIIAEGEVVAQSSTSSEFGIAQVSHSF